jgi:hypothetical protein
MDEEEFAEPLFHFPEVAQEFPGGWPFSVSARYARTRL